MEGTQSVTDILTVLPSIVSVALVGLLLKWRPDRDSTIAEGSKSAVEAMKIALDAANTALDEAEATIVNLRAELQVMRIRLDQIESKEQIAA